MTAYQFRIFDSNDPTHPLLGVVSADDEQAEAVWAPEAPEALAAEMDANFSMKLTQREGTPYADQPPTEILRYNLPFLTTANTEFPDLDAARASAEQIIAENQNGVDYEAGLPTAPEPEEGEQP